MQQHACLLAPMPTSTNNVSTAARRCLSLQATDMMLWSSCFSHSQASWLICTTTIAPRRCSGRVWAVTPVVQGLLEGHAAVDCVNDSGRTGLLAAAQRGHCAVVQLLLRHKADVARQSPDRLSSLHFAAAGNRSDIAVALLEANARVDAENSDGITPLMRAAKAGHGPIVNLLLRAGAAANHRSTLLDTPLHCASLGGCVATVQALLNATAEANAANFFGLTPLIHAADHGYNNALRLLLTAKASVNMASKRGDTPLIWAIRAQHVETAALLMVHGADWPTNESKSARQLVRRSSSAMQSLFCCRLCGWRGMCCPDCRTRFCSDECAKFSGACATIPVWSPCHDCLQMN